MRILITGCSGFIGGSAGNYAATAGHQVLGISRSDAPTTDWLGKYVTSEIAAQPLSEVIAEFAPEALIHSAGPASVASSLSNPLADFNDAAVTCANVLEAVRR